MTSTLRIFGLAETAHNLGLAIGKDGLWLAGAPLLQKNSGVFAARSSTEIASLFSAAYGDGQDWSDLPAKIQVVAEALNAENLGRAQLAALLLRLPELEWACAIKLAQTENSIAKYNYSPSEPRDWHGRWTSNNDDQFGTPSEFDNRLEQLPPAKDVNTDTLTPAAYNGYFHDAVAADIAADLRSKGEIVVTEVRLQMADGSALARLDILAFDPTTKIVYA